MKNVCLIGVSGYGHTHYNLLAAEQAAGKIAIVGVTIINPDDEKEKCAHLRGIGCRIFDDYTVMLKELSGVADICFIPTGIPLHRPMTIAALEAGMHVLVEKPAAGVIQDVRAMQEAAEKANRRVAVGYQQMYDPSTLEIKRAILEGRIGAVECMKCHAAWPRDSAYYNRNNWAGRLRSDDAWVLDSPANNAVAHDLMMMLFLAGPRERTAAAPVSVTAELYRANAIETADTVCLRVRTDTGIPLLFYATHACNRSINPEVHVRGTTGTVDLTREKATIETATHGKQVINKLSLGPPLKRMIANVLDMVEGGTAFYCGLDVASMQTIVVNAMHQACQIHTLAGERVALDNGAVRTIIPGIEEAIDMAFEKERLFQEGGIPWARPSGTLDCTGYREFKLTPC
jgi:predicted dehydrogenase